MKNVIRFGVMFLMTIGLANCSSQPRTKWTDPSMRVMVDGDGLTANDYVRVVKALKGSGKWIVVDRRDGLKAIVNEQNMIHKDNPDRFKDEEKYSIWGRLYGIGGVVIARAQCVRKNKFMRGEVLHCLQNLAIVDANTGEVLAAAEGENDDGEVYYGTKISSNWDDTVNELNNDFPAVFEKLKYSEQMHDFRSEAKEEAIRQKEINAREEMK